VRGVSLISPFSGLENGKSATLKDRGIGNTWLKVYQKRGWERKELRALSFFPSLQHDLSNDTFLRTSRVHKSSKRYENKGTSALYSCGQPFQVGVLCSASIPHPMSWDTLWQVMTNSFQLQSIPNDLMGGKVRIGQEKLDLGSIPDPTVSTFHPQHKNLSKNAWKKLKLWKRKMKGCEIRWTLLFSSAVPPPP